MRRRELICGRLKRREFLAATAALLSFGSVVTGIRAFVVFALIVTFCSSTAALESTITVTSPLTADELWKKLGDFCGITAWNPAVERCSLSEDGKQRTVHVYGTNATVLAELESWDDATHSFSWRSLSGFLPVKNFRGTIKLTRKDVGSALIMQASYDASGAGDTEAKESIDRNLFFSLCINGPVVCANDQRSVPAAELVSFEGTSLIGSRSLMLKGYLRRPAGAGPFPAVVLLPGCNGVAEPLDQNWGVRLAEWGYLTLTVDSVSPRGLKNICGGGGRPDMQFDAYRALDFLAGKEFVDAKRAAVLGFSYGGFLGLSAIENGPVEQAAKNRFAAAAAFYPRCLGIKGPMTAPSLILIGEKDDWTPVDECRKLASGQDDVGMSRPKDFGVPLKLIVLADAYHAYDVPWLEKPVSYFGHHLVYNKTATEQSSEALREFLAINLLERRQQQ